MAPGLIFASGASNLYSLVLGMSITPSTITWEMWTPLGPNSLASDCDSDLSAHFPVENDAHCAEPLIDAVAPVNMRVGGYFRSVDLRRRGRTAWEKRKAPVLSATC
jgi:hypothetical protein